MPIELVGAEGITTPGMESGAMPTVSGDAVVESGSNSDGEWVRWADGTQECRHHITLDHTGAFSGPSRLYGGWTYPISFIEVPVFGCVLPIDVSSSLVGANRLDVRSWGMNTQDNTQRHVNTFISVFFETGTVSTTDASMTGISVTATGRWK